MTTVKRNETKATTASNEGNTDSILELFQESIALFHSLRAFAEALYKEGELSASLRGVLFELATKGAQTVPQMARSRPTSRQHIQVLVNDLLKKGLVEYEENPAHARSKLVSLTAAGHEAVKKMHCLEKSILSMLEIGVPHDDVAKACEVLHAIRAVISRPAVLRLIAASGQSDEESGT